MSPRLLFGVLALAACGVPDLDEDGHDQTVDCDDTNARVHPRAAEVCNGIDDDCNGTADDAPTDGATFYADADADGYGDEATPAVACSQPAAFVANALDCDDADARYHPGASESDCADPNDYNCDGSVGFADGDADGFAACEECDDASDAVHPDAVETCNEVDDDCDGVVDDAPTDAATWYLDADGDGHGSLTVSMVACAQPAGAVATTDDCDDADRYAFPGAPEACNGRDDDCDTAADDGWADGDDDGLADCVDACPAYVAPGTASGDGSPWAPHGSLTEAAALLEPGCAEIALLPGTLYGPQDLGTTEAHVWSVAGPEATWIDAQGEGAALRIAGGQTAATVVEGITLTGGAGEAGDGRALPNGGTVEERYTYGGGLFVQDSSPTLRDLVVDGNVVTGCGGGVALIDSDAVFEDSVVVANATEGGGSGAATMRGGGACVVSGSATLRGVSIVSNRSPVGGGIYVRNGAPDTVTLDGVRVDENDSAGAYLHGGHTRVINSTFLHNHSTGIGTFIARVDVVHSTFVGNGRPSGAGYGIQLADTGNQGVIDGNVFYWNRYDGLTSQSVGVVFSRNVFGGNGGTGAQWAGVAVEGDDNVKGMAEADFVDYGAGDLRPSACSLAVDRGTDLTDTYPETGFDLDGLSRPSSGQYDAGAWQAPSRGCE